MIFDRFLTTWRFWRAWSDVRRELTPEERRALADVPVQLTFTLDSIQPSLRGYFYGLQAVRDRSLQGRLVEGTRASGVIEVFAPRHDGSREDFRKTLKHEVDHALGCNETECIANKREALRGPPRKRDVGVL